MSELQDAVKAVGIVCGVNFITPFSTSLLLKLFNKKHDMDTFEISLQGSYFTMATFLSLLLTEKYTGLFKR